MFYTKKKPNACTILSLLSVQGTICIVILGGRLIKILKNSAKDRYFCKITQYVCLGV